MWRESSAPRQRSEREASKNSKSVRLHSLQELLELLAAVGVDRRPLRAVVPDAAALDRLGDRRVRVASNATPASSMGAEVGREVCRRHIYFVKRRARERADRADIAGAGFDDMRRRELQTVYLAQCFVFCLFSSYSSFRLEFPEWIISRVYEEYVFGAQRDLYACRGINGCGQRTCLEAC